MRFEFIDLVLPPSTSGLRLFFSGTLARPTEARRAGDSARAVLERCSVGASRINAFEEQPSALVHSGNTLGLSMITIFSSGRLSPLVVLRQVTRETANGDLFESRRMAGRVCRRFAEGSRHLLKSHGDGGGEKRLWQHTRLRRREGKITVGL